ncbi:hypothetical protein BC830DRAFT_1167420, partial [Chytriomyces sp. MP71]
MRDPYTDLKKMTVVTKKTVTTTVTTTVHASGERSEAETKQTAVTSTVADPENAPVRGEKAQRLVAAVADLLASVRRTSPLVHSITNYVAMNDNANAALAIGASPIMAH